MNVLIAQVASFAVIIGGMVYLLVVCRRKRKAVEKRVDQLTREAASLREEMDATDARIQTAASHEKWYLDVVNGADEMVLAYRITEDEQPREFIEVNDKACLALELTREELLTKTMLDIETVSEPGGARPNANVDRMALANTQQLGNQSTYAVYNIQQQIKRVMRGDVVEYEGSYVSGTGRRIPVEISARRADRDGQPVVLCIARDVTNRIAIEAKVKESDRRFKDLFTSSPIGVATYDGRKALESANLACLRILGIPDTPELARFKLFDSEFIPASAREEINRGRTVRTEVVIDFDKVLERGLFVSNKRGVGQFDVLFSNLGEDHEFNALGYIVQIQDVTKWRDAEEALDMRERQLRQAQKMEAVGTMTGGIAHDFNNILTPILGYADLGLSEADEGDDLHEYLKEIRKATMRAKALVHQILVFSRKTETADSDIHLIPIVKEVAKQQSTALPREISVTRVIRTEEDLCRANPVQVHQVLTNFCTNAAYAMRDTGGELEVRLSVFTLGWRHRREFPDLKRGRYVRISVRDTGCGIEPDLLENIFDPFFSTKPRGEGTGMGLAVVREIVRSLGGEVAVESALDEGSTFHVALPLVEAVEEEVVESWEAPPSGDETVLMVDDEPDIVRMAGRMLTSLGYHPVGMSDSLKALESFRRSPDSFDVMVTDIVMPEMSGQQLIEEVRAIRPDLPIVICSGFSEKFTPERAREMGIKEFLVKPIGRQELGGAIRRAIGFDHTAALASGELSPAPEDSQKPDGESE